jgi:hypothetical protein
MRGYRTLITSAVIAVLGVIQQADLVQIVPSGYDGLAMTLIGAVMAGLRFTTATPVGRPRHG